MVNTHISTQFYVNLKTVIIESSEQRFTKLEKQLNPPPSSPPEKTSNISYDPGEPR